MKRLFLLIGLLLCADPTFAQNTWTGTLGSGLKPATTIGREGDWFVDTTTYSIWGPKTSGSWGASASGTVAPALPAFTGDCTAAAGTSALVCLKTNGVAFVASATTDATNSTNHTSGTEPIGRLGNIGQIAIKVPAVNFNAGNTDTTVPITLPTGITRFQMVSVKITNASASLSTATIGVFTGAGGTGQVLVANSAITVTATAADTNNNMMQFTPTNVLTEAYNDASIFVRIGTAQGSAATGDVIITIAPLT